LERNPMLLPGARTPSVKSGHYPLHCAAISQPRLPGLSSKIPDFMWIATHSLTWYPTLIEIKSPTKRIFTKDGIPSAEFNQARNQLAQWRTWFSMAENVQQFIKSYGIPDYLTSGRQMQLHTILIYGRRSEVENDPALSKHRGSLLNASSEELMSFDRLEVEADLVDAITVRAIDSGKYRALAVPPLFRLTPGIADRLLAIENIEECLKETPMISEERRSFLLSRLPYWRDWAKRKDIGVINMGDIE